MEKHFWTNGKNLSVALLLLSLRESSIMSSTKTHLSLMNGADLPTLNFAFGNEETAQLM